MSQAPKILTGLGQIVSALAEDAQTIMVSLYDLQKTLREPRSPLFAPVRKQLRDQWEEVRSYLQKCHGFGVDVLTLKDLVKTEAKEDLVDFLEEMRDSAATLRDSSRQLKDRDMSVAFSKKVKLSTFSRIFSYFSSTPRNANLKSFVTAVGGSKNHKTVIAIDTAIIRTKSNLENAFRFWDTTFTQCSTLIEQFKSGHVRMAAKDADRIGSEWRVYQEAINKAIISITMTDDAILVEADVHAPVATSLRLAQLGWEGDRR